MYNKIYFFTILLNFFPNFLFGTNDFFITNSYNSIGESENVHHCVTNSSRALSFVDVNNGEILQTESFFVPKSENQFKTKISAVKWPDENSLTGQVSEIILDRRWEGLKLFTTGETLNYINVTHVEGNFTIPFSIRGNGDGANIFLCDEKYPLGSNCFLLQLAKNGSEMRFCKNATFPFGAEDAKKFCSNLLKIFKGISYVDEQFWSHFKLQKIGHLVRLSKIYKNEEATLIELDKLQISDGNNIIIHSSSDQKLFWKFHDIDYFITRNTYEYLQLGIFTNITDNSVCISMFVVMCRTCSMIIKLQDANENVIKEEEYRNNYLSWTEIKFIAEGIYEKNGTLSIFTCNTQKGGFWALGKNIRTCEKKEFRVITTSRKMVKCELIDDDPKEITLEENLHFAIGENMCPEHNTISRLCVPYDLLFLNRFQELKICENFNKQKTCHCWPNSKDFGLRNIKPNVRNKLSGEILVDLINISSLTPYEQSCLPKNYFIEFKVLHDGNWTRYPSNFTLERSGSISISGLKPSTQYLIRFHLISSNGNIYEDHSSLESSFRTTCCGDPNNFNITWDQSVLYLRPKQLNKTNKNMQCFNLTVFSENDKNITNITKKVELSNAKVENVVSLSEMQEYINYNVELSSCGKNVIVDDIILIPMPSFDVKPNIYENNGLIEIDIPIESLKMNSPANYTLLLLISSEKRKKLENVNLSRFYRLYDCEIKNLTKLHFVLGKNVTNNTVVEGCSKISNFFINPGTSYNVTIVLNNTFSNQIRYKLYSKIIFTKEEQKQLISLTSSVMILMIPSIFLIILYWKCRRNTTNNDKKCEDDWLLENLETSRNVVNQVNTNSKTETSDEYENRDVKRNGFAYFSNPVKVENFLKYVKDAIFNNKLTNEHKMFLSYLDSAGYDSVDGNIVIEYVRLYYKKIRKSYVIAKVPKPEEKTLFWETVWNENVECLVLIDDISDRENSSRYWPEKNEGFTLGDICVELTSTKNFSNFEKRQFLLRKGINTRQIHQLRFISWSIEDQLLHSLHLLSFFRELSQSSSKSQSPVLVQSRSDLQRVCFVVLCDTCLDTARAGNTVDVLECLHKINICAEKLMLYDIKLYVLSHLVIVEDLMYFDANVTCSFVKTDMKTIFSDRKMRRLIQYLKDTKWIDLVEEHTKKIHSDYYYWISQKRDDGKLLCVRRPVSYVYPDLIDTFNAATIDGFRWPSRFLIIPEEQINDFEDFWQVVHQSETSVIIYLNGTNLPSNTNHFLTDPSFVTLKYREKFGCYELINLSLRRKYVQKNVQIVSLYNWNDKDSVKNFVKFSSESNALSKLSERIIILYQEDNNICGLYTAMLYNIDNIKIEGVCDILTCVRTVRRCRQFLTEEQFKFLCQATLYYISHWN